MSGRAAPKVFLYKDEFGHGTVPATFEKVRYTMLWTSKPCSKGAIDCWYSN